jgi:hypothetical protein
VYISASDNETCIIFTYSPCVLDRDTQSLHATFVEYIDGARLYLENEADKEVPAVRDIKLHFCNFIRKMIKSFCCKYAQGIYIFAHICGGFYCVARINVRAYL